MKFNGVVSNVEGGIGKMMDDDDDDDDDDDAVACRVSVKIVEKIVSGYRSVSVQLKLCGVRWMRHVVGVVGSVQLGWALSEGVSRP